MPELLVAWVAFPAIQILIWLGCGSLASFAAPSGIPRALLAPIGFCVVVVVGGFTTAVPDLAWLTTPVLLVLALAGYLLAPPWRGGWPSPWLAAGLVAVFAVYAAPIVLSGSATFAGYIRLDDTATWLALTDRVMEAGRDIDNLAPSSYETTLFFNLADGYPVGAFIPLGVGRGITGMDAAWLIQPYMALLAVLLGLAMWDLAGRLITSARAKAVVVFVAAQPALLFGYYLWGGIKELAAAALIALVACLAFRAAEAGGDRHQAWGQAPGVGPVPVLAPGARDRRADRLPEPCRGGLGWPPAPCGAGVRRCDGLGPQCGDQGCRPGGFGRRHGHPGSCRRLADPADLVAPRRPGGSRQPH